MRSLLVLALLATGAPSFAEMQHPRHSGDQTSLRDPRHSGDQARLRDSRHSGDQARARAQEDRDQERTGKPAIFVGAIDRTIHACGEQAIELRKLPLDAISQSAQLRGDQRAALARFESTAMAAAKALDTMCPSYTPPQLTAKIDALDGALGSIADSLSRLRPVLATFYDLLDDEQKARLVVMNLSGNSSANVSRGKRKEDPPHEADAGAGSICAQWAANLRSWPLKQIESRMQFSDEQHAALYELTAAIYRSAADLVEACPVESLVTPLARLDAKEHELQAVRQDLEAIRPFAVAFEGALNEDQRKRLAQQVEASGGSRQAR